MGCNQSKATEASPPPPSGDNTTKSAAGASAKAKRPASPFAKKPSQSSTLPQTPDPAALYHHLLSGLNHSAASDGIVRARTASFWEDTRGLCTATPALASYVDPDTRGSPLHVACSLGSAQVCDDAVGQAAVSCIEALVDACPDAVRQSDKHMFIPLEGIFTGMRSAGPHTIDDGSVASAFHFRTEAAKMLLACEPRAVPLGGKLLYQIIESLPDDAHTPLGPTVGLMTLLVDKGGATAQPSTSPQKDARPSLDDDAVLALLYRRFVRQFDQSERFFEGDNSREEVVQHRQRFKNAAVNTFNIIELLLRGEQEADDDLLIHNAVRAGACLPDLLRYIVETNLDAVAVIDAKGNLPLHYAAGFGDATAAAASATNSAPESYSKYVIDELLYAYPEGASCANADGVLPIVLAIESGKKWIGGGIRSLHDAYPPGIEQAHLAEQHPLINALSFQSQEDEADASCIMEEEPEQQDAKELTPETAAVAAAVDGSGGRRRKRRQRPKINKDESHDAIMLVQRPGAPVRDVVTTMWANEEDGGVQMLGCSALELAAAEAGSNEESVAAVALLGVTTVVNAMKNHPNEPAVQVGRRLART